MTKSLKIELETVTFEWDPKEDIPKSRQEIVGQGAYKICDAYKQGKKSFALEVPPRCGKSDIIYAVSRELAYTDKTITVCIAPWRTLADQLRDPQKFKRHTKYYKQTKVGKAFTFCCTELPDGGSWFKDTDEHGRQMYLFTTTIGKARINKADLMNGFGCLNEQSKARPILIVDESQLLRDDKPWGELLKEAISKNVFVIVMTGTAYRADGKECSGFEYKPLGQVETSKQRYIKDTFIDDDGQKKGNRITVEAARQKKTLVPDYQVTWDEAWKAGALCKVSAVFVDDDAVCLEEKDLLGEVVDSFTGKLSEVPSSTCRKYLRQIVEQPSLIDECAKLTVSRLNGASICWKNKRPQWIVMAGSDIGLNDEGDGSTTAINKHARSIQRSLEHAAKEIGRGDFTIKVATMANQDSSPDNLADFKAGKIDILIVKMMGVVGLDLETIVGCTMLSTLRDGPTWAQFVTRCLTVRSDGKNKIGCLILPSDCYSKSRWDSIKDQGGEATASELKEIAEDVVSLHSTECTTSLGNTYASTYKDNFGNSIDGQFDCERLIEWVRKELKTEMTDPQILRAIELGMIVPPKEAFNGSTENTNENKDIENDTDDESTVEMSDSSEFSKKAREEIEILATAFANRRASYSDDKLKWVKTKRDFYTKMKTHAGVHPNIEISNVKNGVRLKSMLQYARGINV